MSKATKTVNVSVKLQRERETAAFVVFTSSEVFSASNGRPVQNKVYLPKAHALAGRTDLTLS